MAEKLRKLREDGVAYSRPEAIDVSIDELLAVPRDELVRRSRITDRRHPEYIPSECLLHFIRRSRANNTDRLFQELFRTLRQRVIQALSSVQIERTVASQ